LSDGVTLDLDLLLLVGRERPGMLLGLNSTFQPVGTVPDISTLFPIGAVPSLLSTQGTKSAGLARRRLAAQHRPSLGRESASFALAADLPKVDPDVGPVAPRRTPPLISNRIVARP